MNPLLMGSSEGVAYCAGEIIPTGRYDSDSHSQLHYLYYLVRPLK